MPATLLAIMLFVAACGPIGASPSATEESGASAESASSDEPTAEQVSLTVVSLRPGSEEAAFAAFEDAGRPVRGREPDVDVESVEYEWTGPTFAAQLAGGTLPDVFTIPFTDGKGLIEQGQLADISAQFNELPYAGPVQPERPRRRPG